jgi:PAS domain S-box-containing protein
METKLQYWIKQGERRKELIILVVSAIGLIVAFIVGGFTTPTTSFLFMQYAMLLLLVANALVFRRSIKQVVQSRRINKELSNQTQLFHTALNSITDGLIKTGRKGEIIYMNAVAERLTGWKTRDARGEALNTVLNIVNKDTGLPINNIVQRIITTRKRIAPEHSSLLKTKAGDTLVISYNGSPLFDSGGSISGTVLVFNDITEKNVMEGKIKERENQYRTLIQNLPVAVYTCDEFGYIQLYNKAAVELWGRKPVPGDEQWCGSWKSFTPGYEEISKEFSSMATALKTQKAVYGEAVIMQQPSGKQRHVLPCPAPLFDDKGKLTGAVNLLIDITEAKEKDLLIRETEEKYRSFIEQASDCVIVYSFDGTIHEFNPASYLSFGYTKEEFSNMSLHDLLAADQVVIDPEDAEKIRAGIPCLFTRKIKKKNGTIAEVEISSSRIVDDRNFAIARDVTERKKAEEKIREINERYNLVMEATSDAIWDFNFLTGEMYRNEEGWRKLFGISDGKPIQNVKEEWYKRIHPEEMFKIDDFREKLYNFPDFSQFEMDVRMLKDDATYAHMVIKGSIVRDASGRPVRVVSAAKDITDKKLAEAISEKERIIKEREINDAVLSAQENERNEIGRELHDNINQLLASARLYLLRAKKESCGDLLDKTDSLLMNAIQEIRTLSHSLIPPSLLRSNLVEALGDLLDTTAQITPVAIHTDFRNFNGRQLPDKFNLAIYRIIQEQLTNILKHAKAKNIYVALVQQDKSVVLGIKDDGVGFDVTKKSDGVGLMNIKTRASLFNGKVEIISAPGKGCKLTVTFTGSD